MEATPGRVLLDPFIVELVSIFAREVREASQELSRRRHDRHISTIRGLDIDIC